MNRYLQILLALLLANKALPREPDLILHNGRIVTVDRDFSIRSAIAIQDGRVLRTGSDAEMLALRGPFTEVRHLHGKMVLPGLIDSHSHPASACMTEFEHPIPTMETIPDVLKYVRQRAQVVPEGEWIVVRQVFITRLREQRYPTRTELDQAAPRHPVLFATGPDASLNSQALRLSGIDRAFQVTDGGSGFVEKDAQSGEPTGILRNCTRFVKVTGQQRQPSDEDRLQRLTALFHDYNSVGITGVCERDGSVADIELFQKLRARGGMTIRLAVSQGVTSIGSLDQIQSSIRQVAASPLFRSKDDWLRLIGIKTYLDGGMLTGSAFMREPWGVSSIYGIKDPAYRGVQFIPKDRLRTMVRTAAAEGLQFTAHSVGDGAVHTLLEVYDELDREMPLRATRPCISHSNFMSREAVDMAARLSVSVDIQPAWLWLDTRTFARQFGHERLRWFQPLHSLFEAGVTAGGGSDHMQKIGADRAINPYNPFLGIATAVNRRAKHYEGRLHPEEVLSREQAIRFYTVNNAKILFRDADCGSLEPGKLADFIILDRNLLTCRASAIAGTRVEATYLAGKAVFRASN